MHSEWPFCSYPSYYAATMKLVYSINLAIMNAWKLLYSYLYVPQRYIAVSFNKCTYCKSLWIKASAKRPKCKCKYIYYFLFCGHQMTSASATTTCPSRWATATRSCRSRWRAPWACRTVWMTWWAGCRAWRPAWRRRDRRPWTLLPWGPSSAKN